MTSANPASRREQDFLGAMDIPASAYWGVHSARAVDNFPISGQTVATMPELVRALAYVKKAAAQANAKLGVIDAARADAIQRACDDLIGGALHEQFVVDVIQGGAGTSTYMNANEVIANRALEHLGHARAYEPAPEAINASQRRTTSIRPRCASRPGSASRHCSARWPSCAARSRPRRSNSRAC
jgi:aspartate ammonia-lyase